MRSSVAYAVSAIAHWDWPEAWPDLFDILMQALTSGDPNAVHGAMRVLAGKGICISFNFLQFWKLPTQSYIKCPSMWEKLSSWLEPGNTQTSLLSYRGLLE